MLPGLRLYTHAWTIRMWGAGGRRNASFESYSSRGRKVTWPVEHGNWSTCRRLRPDVAKHWLPPELPEYWLEDRLCRFPESIVTGRRWVRPESFGYFNPFRVRSTRNHTGGIRQYGLVSQPNDGPSADWLARRNRSGFATSYGQGGTRIERALVAERSPLVVTLRWMRELMRPPVIAVNDNQPPDEAGENNGGTGFERIHNQGCITPSVPMLLRAYRAGTATGVRELKDGWHRIGPTKGRSMLTGLIFQDGQLVAYGDDRGRKCKPAYKADPLGLVFDKDSETAKHVAAEPEENVAYTKLKAAGVYVSSQRPDAPGAISPAPRTVRAVANDNILAAAIANTPVMPAVKKCPDGVAHEYGRLAGLAEMKGAGDGKTSAPLHDALMEMDRAARMASAGIDEHDLDIVEDILCDSSFRAIGMRFTDKKSSASHVGRKAVEDTLEKISKKIAA